MQAISDWCSVPRTTGKKVPHGEESMEHEKDQFEDDEELSRLEDDEELGGEQRDPLCDGRREAPRRSLRLPVASRLG